MVFVPRANCSVPSTWLSLRWTPGSGDPLVLFDAVTKTNLPLDLTRHASIWGQNLPEGLFTVVIGGVEACQSNSESAAANLVEASIFQYGCSLKSSLSLYVLDATSDWTEVAFQGALQAMELARSDGMIRFSGVSLGTSQSIRLWQENDAFEFVLSDQANHEFIQRLAKERGVGLVSSESDDQGIELIPIRAIDDLDRLSGTC